MTYKIIDINESYCRLITDDIEFKKKVIDTLSVYIDGYQYDPRYRAGLYDGKKKFYSIIDNNIQFPKGLVSYVIKDLEKNNCKYEYTPSKIYDEFISENELTEFIETLELPFEPYDYQFKAVLNMINKRRLVLRSATGSGKSLIAYIFFRYMLHKNRNTILVVPSVNLVRQMNTDFIEYGFKDAEKYIKLIGGEYSGTKDLSEKPIVISTWQSLQHMTQDQFKIFSGIVIDECHTAKADVLDNIIKNATSAEWKIGMTGTLPKPKADKIQLLGTLGETLKVITPGGLISKGLATPITINALYLNYSEEDKKAFHSKSGKKDYKKEVDYIENHYNRNNTVANILVKLAEKGNVLGTFSFNDHGESLVKKCVAIRTGLSDIELIYKITPKVVKEAFEKWEENKNIMFFVNEEFNRKKIEKIVSDEEFIKNFKPLKEIDIFLITGKVSAETREKIRTGIEDIHPSTITLEFGDLKVTVSKNVLVPLADGSKIKASDLTLEHEILDEWIYKNSSKIG